jgi:hypothetical protein
MGIERTRNAQHPPPNPPHRKEIQLRWLLGGFKKATEAVRYFLKGLRRTKKEYLIRQVAAPAAPRGNPPG